MPTAFTPNNDGLNDRLKPFLAGVQGLRRFTIYNRLGQVVFNTTSEGMGWDGTFRGVPLDPAVFVWTIEYFSNSGKAQIQKGTVTLIR